VPTNIRNGFYAGLLLAAIAGIFLFRLWQPERQVELHSVHLLAAIQKQDWPRVREFISDDYQDRWGNDRALLLERTRTVFLLLRHGQIEASSANVKVQASAGVWQAKITIKNGEGEIAPAIEERVNSLPSPFNLEWRRRSGKPWDWKLVRVDNPALEIAGY
jgi:hypothetical protein